ncbi:putative Poly [ADP-ribose] polymerase [Cocos nucifera]|uniref:Poly [ADP-ribose] polymerase 1 n=1 Tax=Cocos nucifera TaxID=13894 RepID=A0A8K0IFG5_COCNU|nr:putative Poly [ADP-ribose] polymerase [Cocos nucifera]
MAAPPKPWKAEYAKSGRSSCKSCKNSIGKDELRLGKMVTATQFDGFMPVRVSTKPEGQGSRGLAWHHVNCFIEMSPSTIMEKIPGWDSLSPEDKVTVTALIKKDKSNKNTVQEQQLSKGTKRKKVGSEDHHSKVPKSDENDSAGGVLSKENPAESGNAHSSSVEFEKKLEEQSKTLWEIKDELKKHVMTAELREMLEANGQDSAGSEYDLRDRCADGMLFGALGKCPICSGSLHYSGGQYRCHGYVSAWSRCSYSTTDPLRLKEKWKIPEETSNQYLLKWFKSQKAKKPNRVLPPSSNKSSCSTGMQLHPSNGDNLESLKVSVVGEPQEANIHANHVVQLLSTHWMFLLPADTNCLVLIGEMVDNDSEIRKARRMKIPIVREDYLHECIRKQKKIPFDLYKVEAASETSTGGMVTVKVKGRSAVHEASGLQDVGHILEDGNSIYNTTLNMSDLSTGINRVSNVATIVIASWHVPVPNYLRSIGQGPNSYFSNKDGVGLQRPSFGLAILRPFGMGLMTRDVAAEAPSVRMHQMAHYYILQIIQEDKGSACYVFRKWGRVGNDKIGGTKLEEMSRSDAIQEFKRLFLEKTGNPWEAWEQKKNFEKQPGRFFPLDIDYGVKQVSKKKDSTNTKSLLAPQLIELMKMLFDVETYRAAMLEFEINMSEMPLGKLSKMNIQKGFEALTEIQNLLKNNAKHDPFVKESLIVDASNRFFTVIPSIHPHVIRDEDDFKAKASTYVLPYALIFFFCFHSFNSCNFQIM